MTIKPIIGITMNEREDLLYVKDLYVEKIVAAGGYPILLPSDLDTSIVHKIDGLLLTGGGDVAPSYFGQEPDPNLGRITPRRDQFELTLTEMMVEQNKPVLAICRGMQVVNVAMGGTVVQHLKVTETPYHIQHDQQAPTSFRSHSITVYKNSRLYQLLHTEKLSVNSFHHQAVGNVSSPFIVSARAKDGVIEAIESTVHRFIIGVQWHPECLQGEDSDVLFSSFITESRKTT